MSAMQHAIPAPSPATTRSRRILTTPANTLAVYTTAFLLRSGARTAAIWMVCVAGYLVALTFSFHQISPALTTTEYPEGLAKAFHIDDMHSISGFLSTEVFSFIPIVLAVYPIVLMASALAGAEERSQLDMLLGTPLSRMDLAIAKAVSATILIAAMLLAIASFGWLGGVASGEHIPASTIYGATLALGPFMAFFGGVTLVFSALAHRFATAMGLGVGVLLAMYALDLVARITERTAFGWFSAFHYYGTPMLDGVDWAGAVGMSIAAILLGAVAVILFRRRDIYS
ncbi:MAG: ABC transporter permease subunit [Thermomicrobiales bacterium]